MKYQKLDGRSDKVGHTHRIFNTSLLYYSAQVLVEIDEKSSLKAGFNTI